KTPRERQEVRWILVSYVVPRHTNRRGGSSNQRFILWFNRQARLFNKSVKNLCKRFRTVSYRDQGFAELPPRQFLTADGVHPIYFGVALMAEHLGEVLPRGAPPSPPLWSASPSSVAVAADADAFWTTGPPLTWDTAASSFKSASVSSMCGGEHHG
ncbi:unnamed protein product, partial [Ixodes pacificus]